MTLKEKMQKLIERNKEGKKFTTVELNGIGFNSSEITKLKNSGVLNRVSRGFYTVGEIKIDKEAMKVKKETSMAEVKHEHVELDENSKYMNEIFFSLTEGNTNLAMSLVHEFLEKLGQSKYEFLILDLIRLSILAGDISFTDTLMTLSFMVRGIFSFDIATYIRFYYEDLIEGNIKDARVYLDIIVRAEELDVSLINRITRASKTNMSIEKIIEEKDNVLSLFGVKSTVNYEEYMIPEMDIIINAIIEEGMDILPTCLGFGLGLKQINFIKLKVAEEYLIRGYKNRADALIKDVKTSPNLDEALMELLMSIKECYEVRV